MRKGPLAQGRRVRLVVRRIEPWTVLKFSVLLFATLYLVMLVAGLVLWTAATATGLRDNVENFIGELIASEDFRILGPTMFRASVVGGLVLVVMGTGANVLFAVLYNLISDVVGGIVVVFEERRPRRRQRVPATVEGDGAGADTEPLKPGGAPRWRLPAPRRAGPDTTPMPDPPAPVPQVQPQQVEPAELSRRPSD